MNFVDSLYKRKPRRHVFSGHLTQQDLFIYEAIVGKPALPPRTSALATALPPTLAPIYEPIPITARRWKPVVADLTVRLRTMFEANINQALKPQVSDWLRNMSEEAIKRLDQAQIRLHGMKKPTGRNVVAAKEAIPNARVTATRIHGGEESTSEYKRAA
jgi:hypothetical protein